MSRGGSSCNSSNHQVSLVVAAAAAATAATMTTAMIVYWRRNNRNKKTTEPPPQHCEDEDVGGAEKGSGNRVREIVVTTAASVSSEEQQQQQSNYDLQRRILKRGNITIAHGSVTGTNAKFAKDLYDKIRMKLPEDGPAMENVHLATIDDFDWWDELINDDEEDDDFDEPSNKKKNHSTASAFLLVLLPTYTHGTWPPTAVSMQDALHELQNDWRIAKHPLKDKLKVAVFGTGSSEYDDNGNMGKPAKEAVAAFYKLGAKIFNNLQIGDDYAVGNNHAQVAFELWSSQVLQKLGFSKQQQKQEQQQNEVLSADKNSCGCGNQSMNDQNNSCCRQTNGGSATKDSSTTADESACCSSNNNNDGEQQQCLDEDDEDEFWSEDGGGEPEIIDLEDMGDAVMASRQGGDASSQGPREMVTPSQAKALKKEGYKLIGTHSAVKLCRWTKHQLRGRGGCYKHSFYGITSYQCMEATPSLACANKCVFCWRHHKNPVGKEWRWKTDDPHFIVEQAVQTHVKMIKETRGIPGIKLDRWQEAHTVRHCALSLVGEPIMYPRIEELLADLHQRKISTFLVTNGQHPGAIGNLRPITQLYVSVDAPTPDSLVAIDRPLFHDAWDRLNQSLSSLKDKGQRTVARLTVVKGWNSDEISGYAKLIALGQVSLVEVKGVTFCGKSDASNLNMSNTPWHHEVVDLTRTLRDELVKMRRNDENVPEYDLACEHKHSCSVLLARVDQFADVDENGQRKWRTWIDYDKFQILAAKNAEDPSFTFTVKDYTAETPNWALFGSEEEGFDPTETRFRKKTKHPKYTKFDDEGIPTHDADNRELNANERALLAKMMEQRMNEIGAGSTVTELRGGEKEILDASLMFRGMVVSK